VKEGDRMKILAGHHISADKIVAYGIILISALAAYFIISSALKMVCGCLTPGFFFGF